MMSDAMRTTGAGFGKARSEHAPWVATGLVAVALAVPGCGWLGIDDEQGALIASGDGHVDVNGVTNEPTGPVATAATIQTPIGELAVETYDSELGPCVTFHLPEQRKQAQCLQTSGIVPDKDVTGAPGASIEGINGAAWNAGLVHDDIGMLHYGLAHPSIVEVHVEVEDGGDPAVFDVIRAPNVADLRAFVAWSGPDDARHRLVGYDGHGCQVDTETVDVRGRHGGEKPGLPRADDGC